MDKRALIGIAMVAALGLSVTRPATAVAAIQLIPVLSGLDNPVLVTNAHDGSNRLFIVEQVGVIKVLQPGAAIPRVVLDISAKVMFGGEQGLLGLTFHPQFSSNGRFFVDYTRKPDGATVIAEYHISPGNPDVALTAESVLLVIAQPFANHNGGMVEFGHDGFLYIAMGDGGSANDPNNFAQDVNQLLGKILRIDVDHQSGGMPYAFPPDNPFVGAPSGRGEIFALGLRNPFRFSFDRATGALYAGDVGQDAVEEIDIITRGGNYGWRIWEGTQCTGNDPGLCNPAGFIFPITEYTHMLGRCAVIGGYVYRGARGSLPLGSYVYGDLCTGELFLLQNGASSVILDTALSLSSFGEDEAGEVYVIGLGGTVDRIADACDPAGTPAPSCPAIALSASVNQPAFSAGQTLFGGVGLTNPGVPVAVDFYVGIVLPDGRIVFFTSAAGATALGALGDFGSFAPIATGASMATASSVTVPDLVDYQWTGSEQRGIYTLFVLAVRAGALLDGVLDGGEIVALATAAFSFM